VRAAASLAWVMAINAARNQDRSGKGLAVEGLANSRAVVKKGWATSARIQPPRSAICRHAPENAQSHSAIWCYTTHSPPAVASPPCSAAYAPLLAGLRPFSNWTGEFILQNLILRTRSCVTGFITQYSWFFYLLITESVNWK